MDVIKSLFDIVLVIMIVSTMLGAGLATTFSALGAAFRNVWLVVLALAVNLLLVPLIGWGVAALFSLATPAFIGLVLLASSPGGPFGAKLAMIQRGDIVTGGALQVLLAAIGSVTFAVTANLVLSAAHVGGGISLPVGRLILTVAVLQLVPFAIGLALRNWAPDTAQEWRPVTLRISNFSFMLVVAGALLGSWQEIVDLLGSRTLLAGIVYVIAIVAAGTVISVGPMKTRTTVGLVTSARNAGPIFAAIGIAFSNDPQILGAVAAVLVVGLVISLPFAAYLARSRAALAEPAAVTGAPAGGADSIPGRRPQVAG